MRRELIQMTKATIVLAGECKDDYFICDKYYTFMKEKLDGAASRDPSGMRREESHAHC